MKYLLTCHLASCRRSLLPAVSLRNRTFDEMSNQAEFNLFYSTLARRSLVQVCKVKRSRAFPVSVYHLPRIASLLASVPAIFRRGATIMSSSVRVRMHFPFARESSRKWSCLFFGKCNVGISSFVLCVMVGLSLSLFHYLTDATFREHY